MVSFTVCNCLTRVEADAMDEEKPQQERLKLIRANDGKGGLDSCDRDCFAGLQEAEQVLVVDGFLAVGEFGEARVDFVELVALERVAEFFETVG